MSSLTRILVVISLVAIASPALAETTNANVEQTPSSSTVRTENLGWHSWGVRLGVTDDSDQVVGGAHVNCGEPFNNVRLQPDLQLGSGDDHTTIYGTVPLYYRFDIASRMTPYAGGGLALGYVDVDLPEGSNGDDSSFEVGGRATGGLEWPRAGGRAFFVELSLGFGDVHDATVLAAWTF
jgi:opacity protein-like surface antigen